VLVPALEALDGYKAGLVDTGTYSKGWDRYVGMAKYCRVAAKMRFLQSTPLSWASGPKALADWAADPRLTLLSSLGYVYDAPDGPLAEGCSAAFGGPRPRGRKRGRLEAADAEQSGGERACGGVGAIEALVSELLAKHNLPPGLRFETGPVAADMDVAGRPRGLKAQCAASNRFCPFRDLKVDEAGALRPSGRPPHQTMCEGKVAIFMDLRDPFPAMRFNCFSPNCRGNDTFFFTLGRLVPAQVERLLRALG
jgi:hypothetical protein